MFNEAEKLTPQEIIESLAGEKWLSATERTELEWLVRRNTDLFRLLGAGHLRVADMQLEVQNGPTYSEHGVELTITFRIDR